MPLRKCDSILFVLLFFTFCACTALSPATEDSTGDPPNVPTIKSVGISENSNSISESNISGMKGDAFYPYPELCLSSVYSFDEFSQYIEPGASVLDVMSRFGTVASHSFSTSRFSNDGSDVTYYYYIYPLQNEQFCFVFYIPYPSTGRGDIVEDCILYPSKHFDELGVYLVDPEDIPA